MAPGFGSDAGVRITRQADRRSGAHRRLIVGGRRVSVAGRIPWGRPSVRRREHMATMKMERGTLWEVSSRTIVYAAIGAALYGVLGLFDFLLPGTGNVSIRPAFAIVAFFGYAFGPIVGLFTGLVGNALGDQLHGYGFTTYWNWSLANGLVGLLAGLAPLYLGTFTSSSTIS